MRRKQSDEWNGKSMSSFGTVAYKDVYRTRWAGRMSFDRNRVTVLVVEDEILIRIDLAEQLDQAGYRVFEADCADNAIRYVEQNPDVQLIVTDVDMPGSMDGLKLAAFVRDRWPPIKLIVASGRVVPNPATLPKDVPFLSKPYSFSRLDTLIEALFD